MRVVTGAVFAFCCMVRAMAADLPLHDPLKSDGYGFGPGISVEEIRREPLESQFKVVRLYSYEASTAWGSPQNFFVFCALRDVAIERGFAQVKLIYQVREGADFRAMKPTDAFASVGRDDLYLRTLWLPDDGRPPEKLIQEVIFPVAGTEAFCERLKSRPKRP
jgi:hypothetical protein